MGRAPIKSSWEDQTRRNLDKALAELLLRGRTTDLPRIKSAVIRVELPAAGFAHSTAVGEANADSDASMTSEHQFHLASVAKTMTAILVLQLWEEKVLGPLGLDTTLYELELFDPAVFNSIHNMDGKNYGKMITVRHLLTHTSGLKDAAVDDARSTSKDGGQPAFGSYGFRLRDGLETHMACLANPNCDVATLITSKNWEMWNPFRPFDKEAGVINWFLSTGTAASSLSPPGDAFHYSDTGYVILGLLTEKLTCKSMHRQLRERIFDPLGMDKSYLAYAKDPEPTPWIHEVSDFYLGDVPGVTGRINLSFDRGGGGVVSTVSDLNKFLLALMRGHLFQETKTLEEMLDWQLYPGINSPRAGVGLGIFAERTRSGKIALGHSGVYGAKMYYQPDGEIFFSGTVNQLVGVPYYWWAELLAVIGSGRSLRETIN